MRYTQLELQGQYHEIGPQVKGFASAGGAKRFQFDRFWEQTERIARSRSIGRVLVVRREGFSVSAFAAVHEVADALRRLVDAGKEVWYVAAGYSAVDCVLAAACSHRILHSLGTLSFAGVSGTSPFFQKLLRDKRIGVEVIRRGRYKSAADPFRTSKHDRYSREQLQALVDGAVEEMRRGLEGASEFSPTLIDEMLAGRIFTAPEALERGLVHRLATPGDLVREWKREKVRVASAPKAKGHVGRGKRVAVLVFEGAVVDGESRRDPMVGQAIGDVTMVKAIRALAADRRTRAVVFRINSPGGSATASENVLRELVALNEKKPVVVSMGPVAGSGGYWIATTGRRLFAHPSTITGSIGVIIMYFDLSRFLAHNGITLDRVARGDSADLGSPLRPLTKAERARVDDVVEQLYREFLGRVATFRGTTSEEVHALGEGRVWLGRDAQERNLVDELGGLTDAINHARELIGARRARVSFGPKVKQSLVAQLIAARTQASGGGALTTGALPAGASGAGLGTVSAPSAGSVEAAAALVAACRSLHGVPLFVDPLLVTMGLTGR
ncbi:MAG: signal peptide peptidase SppA [Spirochaetaceae bacterium]|nr:MAG: signal peptide peptidase SppA [Spirochaetaceae bacterium]